MEGVGHVTSVYRQPDPPSTCVWGCGRRNFDVEHIIGKQFAKRMNIGLPVVAHWGDYRETMTKELEISIPNRVCKGCNNGWMRKLDNRVVAFMGDAIEHDAPVTLNEFRQTQLSYWAAKVALLLLVFQYELTVKHKMRGVGPFAIPYENLESVWQRQRPPKGTCVWVGARDKRDDVAFIHQEGAVFQPETNADLATVKMADGTFARDAGYHIMFTIQRLVFAVRGWYLNYSGVVVGEPEDPNGIVPDSMLPIWPLSPTDQDWPPPHCLSSDEVGRICHSEAEWAQ